MESEEQMAEIASVCKKVCEELGFEYVFKASFDKANRTSLSSFRGLGMEKGLKALDSIKTKFSVPVTTDIHESYQAEAVSDVVDILQIPAFLCRQTDLLIAAAKTGRVVNVKKAQFLSAEDMAYPVAKVRGSGNEKVMLTERGTMFGYNNLVVDMRNLVDMREHNTPVVMDITHSTQRPGGASGKSGGDRKFAPVMAAAAAAIGVDGYFIEVHPDPDNSLSDGPNMVRLDKFKELLELVKYHQSYNG